MFNKATERPLRLIAAARYLKQLHSVQFAFFLLIDMGFCEYIARAALQDEQEPLLHAGFLAIDVAH